MMCTSFSYDFEFTQLRLVPVQLTAQALDKTVHYIAFSLLLTNTDNMPFIFIL